MFSSGSSSSRSGFPISARAAAPSWLTSMADDGNTLAGLLDTQSRQQIPEEQGDNTLFRELDMDPALRELTAERTLEPLMSIEKTARVEPEKDVSKSQQAAAATPKNVITVAQSQPGAPKKQAKEVKKPIEAKKKVTGNTGSSAPTASTAAPKTSAPPSSSGLTSSVGASKKASAVPSTSTQSKSRTAPVNTTPSSTSSAKRLKTQPSSASKADTVIDARKKALRASFSAFIHLHHPCMTPAEQAATLAMYDGRETELWQSLAQRFGKDSVPARLLRPVEAAKGSVKIQLTPKVGTTDGEATVDAMKERGLECEAKETITRTTTIRELINDLEFRWQGVEELFRKRNYRLFLFSVGSDNVLPEKAIVRDSIVDGYIEFCWCPSDRSLELEEEDWGGGHSLAAVTSMPSFDAPAKSMRRIQPIPVAQDSISKRIQADAMMNE